MLLVTCPEVHIVKFVVVNVTTTFSKYLHYQFRQFEIKQKRKLVKILVVVVSFIEIRSFCQHQHTKKC